MPLLITLCLLGIAFACTSAVIAGRLAGIGFSVFWSLGVLYLVVPPVYSFAAADPIDVEVLGSIGIVGIMASLQASTARRISSKARAPSPYDVEFHLTADGWVRGTEWFAGMIQAQITPPPTRVLTIIKRVTTNAKSGHDDVSWRNNWRNAAIPDAELAALRSRFAAPADLSARAFEPVEVKSPASRRRDFVSRLFGVDDEPYSGE